MSTTFGDVFRPMAHELTRLRTELDLWKDCAERSEARVAALEAELDKQEELRLEDVKMLERAESDLTEARELLKDCWNCCIVCEGNPYWLSDVGTFINRTASAARNQSSDE